MRTFGRGGHVAGVHRWGMEAMNRNRPGRHLNGLPWLAIAAVVVLGLAACSSGKSGNGSGSIRVGSDGVTNVEGSTLKTQIDALPRATLTADEQSGLTRMREEEKLAHDVYVALGEKSHLAIFTNISSAEQTHTDAVKYFSIATRSPIQPMAIRRGFHRPGTAVAVRHPDRSRTDVTRRRPDRRRNHRGPRYRRPASPGDDNA